MIIKLFFYLKRTNADQRTIVDNLLFFILFVLLFFSIQGGFR